MVLIRDKLLTLKDETQNVSCDATNKPLVLEFKGLKA